MCLYFNKPSSDQKFYSSDQVSDKKFFFAAETSVKITTHTKSFDLFLSYM